MSRLALALRSALFPGANLLVALSHETIAYSLYVLEYNSGDFAEAKFHVDLALRIMRAIMAERQLLVASTKRVQALIMEEMAIDTHRAEKRKRLLARAERLHKDSLELARDAFGELNIQTGATRLFYPVFISAPISVQC